MLYAVSVTARFSFATALFLWASVCFSGPIGVLAWGSLGRSRFGAFHWDFLRAMVRHLLAWWTCSSPGCALSFGFYCCLVTALITMAHPLLMFSSRMRCMKPISPYLPISFLINSSANEKLMVSIPLKSIMTFPSVSTRRSLSWLRFCCSVHSRPSVISIITVVRNGQRVVEHWSLGHILVVRLIDYWLWTRKLPS